MSLLFLEVERLSIYYVTLRHSHCVYELSLQCENSSEELFHLFPGFRPPPPGLPCQQGSLYGGHQIISNKKNTNFPTVKFDAFVIGLNQDNDVTSKIDHFSILVLHVLTS